MEPADRLEVDWGDGTRSAFHHVWLRDNCPCPECRHPEAWERTLDTLDLPLDPRPAAVTAGDRITITWDDGHVTSLSREWLRAHAYEPEARRARAASVTPWTAGAIAASPPLVEWSAIATDPKERLRWLELIRDVGFAVVTGVPTEPGSVLEVARLISYVRETNFGLIFDVMSKPDPENLAYTAVKLNAHTDLPNREALMGLQLLHCLRHDAAGGDSILVDGFAAVARLRERHPAYYELLSSVPVGYRFQDDDNDIRWHAPVIGLDRHGHPAAVRFHHALLAPLDIDHELVPAFYRAYRLLAEALRSPDLEHRFRMRPGDCQVFDNRRVLHARGEFDPQSGTRHFQGCYVDYDDFRSRLRVLERDGADFRSS